MSTNLAAGHPSEMLEAAMECLEAIELDDRYVFKVRADYTHGSSIYVDEPWTEVTLARCVIAKWFQFSPDERADISDIWEKYFGLNDSVDCAVIDTVVNLMGRIGCPITEG